MTDQGYDIIGDVHGCAETLERLLDKMGYEFTQGVYRHPDRQAVFVGDIVDRGPRIREALHIVRNMVESGHAQMIMGNHEYNAIGYTIPSKQYKGKYLREHDARHNRLIAETLQQFAAFPEEWKSFLDWFQTLPLFLEFDHFRVVHACWDSDLISRFKQEHGGNSVSRDFISQSSDKSSFAGKFMDRLTRGTSLPLPDGMAMTSKDGFVRHNFRTKFWSKYPKTYGDLVFQPDPLPERISKRKLEDPDRDKLLYYCEKELPLFVGHYWLEGRPVPLRDNLACLDYSAVKYGRLVAYRMDKEATLSADKFVWVDVRP